MADAVVVLEGLKEPVLVPEDVEVFVPRGVADPVLLDPIVRLSVGVPVPVLVCETDLDVLGEPVEVLEDVMEPVEVPVRLMVRDPLAVLEIDEDPVDVFDDPVDLDCVGDAVSVFDPCPDLEIVGLDEPVLDDVVVAVLVADRFPETVLIGVEVCVLDAAIVTVDLDDPVPDLDAVDVLVDVIDTVVVLVVVVEGLGSIVNLADRVRVVVLVDVFDCVDVAVATIPPTERSLSSTEDKVGENDASNNNARRSILTWSIKKVNRPESPFLTQRVGAIYLSTPGSST